jgi:hypothetical protein
LVQLTIHHNDGLEIVDKKTPIEKGVQFVEKGVQLDPSNQRNRIWLAEARLLNNQLADGLVEARKAHALNRGSECIPRGLPRGGFNPSSLIYMDSSGFGLALLEVTLLSGILVCADI